MASGTISGTTSNRYITVRAQWTSVADYDNNRSTVSVVLQARKSTSSSDATTGPGTWHVYIDGQSGTISKRVTLNPDNNWVTLGTVTKTVSHTADGTKTCTISADGSIEYTTYTSTTLSGTATLDNIPRETKATFDAASKEFGQNVIITLNRADASFYHDVYYVWNSTPIKIGTSIQTSMTWTIPSSLMNDIPNNSQVSLPFMVTTYKTGGTEVGTTTSYLLVNVPQSARPVINSVALTDTGMALPVEWGIFARGKSILHVNVSASGQYNATIAAYRIEALNVVKNQNNVDMATIYQSGTITVQVTVTDSRGLSTTSSTAAQATVYDYDLPVISSFSAIRCNQAKTPVDNGTYALVEFDCSISPLDGNNEMTIRVSYKASNGSWVLAAEIEPSTTSYSGECLIQNISTQYSYDLKVEVEDTLGSISRQIGTISAEGCIMNVYPGGVGISFGKAAEQRSTADFAWRIHGRQGMDLDTPLTPDSGGTGYSNINDFVAYLAPLILLAAYPVGSILMSTSSTNPSEYIGGTWEAWGAGRVPVGAGTGTDDNGNQEVFTADDTGGEYTHTLSIDEMPSHNHTIRGYGALYTKGSYGWRYGSGGSNNDENVINFTGGGEGHNNMQPYIVCYMFRRTA